ncbi:hypothetical protein ABC494_06730 [Staphylococcus hominis]
MMMKCKDEFVVYQGDDIVCAGTREECIQKLGVRKTTFKEIASKRRYLQEMRTKNSLIAVRVPVTEIL